MQHQTLSTKRLNRSNRVNFLRKLKSQFVNHPFEPPTSAWTWRHRAQSLSQQSIFEEEKSRGRKKASSSSPSQSPHPSTQKTTTQENKKKKNSVAKPLRTTQLNNHSSRCDFFSGIPTSSICLLLSGIPPHVQSNLLTLSPLEVERGGKQIPTFYCLHLVFG